MKNPHSALQALTSDSPRPFSMIEALAVRVLHLVPSSGFALAEAKGDEAKALRINIREACKVLSNRLRKIIAAGDGGGYVILREQMKSFMNRFQNELEMMQAGDIHPLIALKAEIDDCDKKKLLEGGLIHMKEGIQSTKFIAPQMRNGEFTDNNWTAIGTALLALYDLARETDFNRDNLLPLGDAFYTKHVLGLIAHIEEKEKDLLQLTGSQSEVKGLIQSLRRELDELGMLLSNLITSMIFRTSLSVLTDLNAKILQHGEGATMREARNMHERFLAGDLRFYRDNLSKFYELGSGVDDEEEVVFRRRNIVSSGDDCLDPVRCILGKIVSLRTSLQGADKTFLEEMEDLLIELHANSIKAGIPIEKHHSARHLFEEPQRTRVSEWRDHERVGKPISVRLADMNRDIYMLSGNTAKIDSWRRTYQELFNRANPDAARPSHSSSRLPVTNRAQQPHRPAPKRPGDGSGGAFGNRDKSRQKTRKFF